MHDYRLQAIAYSTLLQDACPIDLPDEMPALEAKKTRFQRSRGPAVPSELSLTSMLRPSECRVDELVFICEMQILSTGPAMEKTRPADVNGNLR